MNQENNLIPQNKHLEHLIILCSVCTTFLSFVLFYSSDKINNLQLQIIDLNAKAESFVQKNDILNILSPFLKSGFLSGGETQIKQAYYAYLIMLGESTTTKSTEEELRRVQTLDTYQGAVKIDDLDIANKKLQDLFIALNLMREFQNYVSFFLFFFSLASILFATKLSKNEEHSNNHMTAVGLRGN